MVKHREEGMLIARLLTPNSQLVNTKEKFLKEIKSAPPVYTQIIRKWKSLIGDTGESLSGVDRKDQTSHNIPLSQSLIQGKDPALFSCMKAEKGEEAQEKLGG